MIYKKRSEPLSLLGLQSLINRLDRNNKNFNSFEEDLRKRKAGFGGEMNFDKHINEFRPSYPHGFLHDVCLKHNGIYFQMDSILIMPAGIVLFEIKNLGGKITVKANPTQFIQDNNGVRKVLQSPIIELERKKIFLDGWLKERGVVIPIIGMIGLAYTNELYIEEETATEIAFTHELPIKLFNNPIEKELVSKNQIRKIAIEMKNEHQEYNPFPLTKTMQIAPEEIIRGVICPSCNRNGMKWNLRKWQCTQCSYSATDCHLPLLDDWFYLIDNKINNRQFRAFSQIEDRSIAKRLLKKSHLTMMGQRSSSFYIK
ncbi:nuclease-related domain-containing protein [Sporosarcina luteola]|uniref:nuclease-related domain-containing protein n=1 Tax=Sporosarcina luteola TaxID=582850 RepID=UPI00203B4882|nr:nuclease-related domain-containing protein [Sporosarcina luteola]MCM3709283.1 NERD domain-containing protein [Sporosarcina luteola]